MLKATLLKNALAVFLLTASVAACAATSGRETPGSYLDDTAITTKVKAAIFNDPDLKVMQIGVETMQGTVQLSGFVDTEQTKIRAGEVARSVNGVRSVRNDLVVRR